MGRIGPEVAASGAILRQRAAGLFANNPWVRQAVLNWVGALTGSGIVPTHPDCGSFFNEWAEGADAEGRTDFWGFQAEAAQSLVVAGECFIRILQTEDGPRLQLVPPELVDESLTREL